MKFKRGDTFAFSGLMPAEFPEGDWSAACTLQDGSGNPFPVTATMTPPAGAETQYRLELFAAPEVTAAWPVGTLKGDVQFTNAATVPPFVTSSKDFAVDVIADRTP